MSTVFLHIVNMSVPAGWTVLVLLLFRILLRKMPKWVLVLLWGIVALRLICPLSVESALSLIPSSQTISPDIMLEETPQIDTGIPALDDVINPIISENFTPEPTDSVTPLQVWIPIAANVWLMGVAVLLLYTLFSYLQVQSKIRTAVRLRGNVYQTEGTASPFVLGIVKPKIYLPFSMPEQAVEHVIAHEQAHICRRDHLWKPLGFLLLTVHWFNPLIWVSYILLCRDIELACDEKVVKDLEPARRADYSQALLTCSVRRRSLAACPLAFGEVGVKARITAVLRYQEPTLRKVLWGLLVTACVALCFLTDPVSEIVDDFIPDVSVPAVQRKVHNLGDFVDAGSTRSNTRITPVLSYSDRLAESEKIHRSALTDREQQLYDIFLPYILSYTPFSAAREDVRFTLVEMENVTNAIHMDYPETWLYFSSGADLDTKTMRYSYSESCYETFCTNYYSLYFTRYGVENFNPMQVKERIAQINAACDQIIKQMPKLLSNKGKYLWLAEYLCYMTEYAGDMAGDVFVYGYLDGPLLDGKGIGQSYALAYQYLCQKAGLWCTTYSGGVAQLGQWLNGVKLEDGKIYYMNLLWADDTRQSDRYYFMEIKDE